MRKFLSLIVLLSISSMFSFGQNYSVKPQRLMQADEAKTMDQYMSKYTPSTSKAVIFSSEMANTTQWTVSNAADATISTQWVRLADTSMASSLWKQYVGPYMGSATPMNGVYYFDGITNLVNANYGVSNSRLTNATPIVTTGHPSVTLKFYQLYKGFNADSTLLEISSDNVNWTTIDVNPTIAANGYAYGWKEYNISPYAGNKAQVWIRFRFFAPASTSSGAQYGGGYGWMIDDVTLSDADDNKLTFNKLWVTEAYSNIPVGQALPITLEGEFTNAGGLAQANVKLTGKEITTNTLLAGPVIASAPAAATDTAFVENFFTPSTVGTYKITSFLSSDALPQVLWGDTFNVKVNNNGIFARDNDIYYTSKWNGGDGYTVANLYQVSSNAVAYGVKVAVNLATEVGSQIKGVMYKSSGSSRIIVAESDYYTLQASDIPTVAGVAPIMINLPFTTPYTMEKDSVYWAGMAAFGGDDTVRVAVDNSLIAHSGGIPQNYYTSLLFDNVDNKWYVWSFQQQAAMILRVNFEPVGINEVANSNVNLFSCMPNPANNVTTISYELKNTNNVAILVTDITGRTVKTINQGTQTAGNYALDLDLSDLTSGTYFYTLKTENSQATKKLIIVKR